MRARPQIRRQFADKRGCRFRGAVYEYRRPERVEQRLLPPRHQSRSTRRSGALPYNSLAYWFYGAVRVCVSYTDSRAPRKGARRLFSCGRRGMTASTSMLASRPRNLEHAVPIPKPNYDPPFNVTRASHAVLNVKDLGKSRAFYVDFIGFIVSDEDKDTLYLRGVAEACHHSLVLTRASTAEAERVGMRCFTEEDLEKAKYHFEKAGLPAQWVERPYQGKTLHVSDPLGVPL